MDEYIELEPKAEFYKVPDLEFLQKNFVDIMNAFESDKLEMKRTADVTVSEDNKVTKDYRNITFRIRV